MGKLKSLKKPKVFIPLVIALLIVAAFISAVVHLNSPAEGTIVNNPDNSRSPSQISAQSDKTYSDNALNFKYPGKFNVNPSQASNGYIDTVNLIVSQRHDEYVTVGLYQSSLQNDSGVRFRTDRPQQYKQVSSSASELVFSKTDSLEYTGFIQKDDRVISISLTSVGPKNMSGDYQTIANSLALK